MQGSIAERVILLGAHRPPWLFFNPLRLLLPKELLTVQRLRTRFRRLFYTRGIMRGVYGVAESRQR